MSTVSRRVFETAFPPEAQQEMLQADSEAWGAITGILFAIVTGGAVLGIIGVLFSL